MSSSFNPFQGICPSAAGRCNSVWRLSCSVSIPSRESALLRRHRQPRRRVSRRFQSLTGNLPFCGPRWVHIGQRMDANVSIPSREFALLRLIQRRALHGFAGTTFQSLPGNLPFCGPGVPLCGPGARCRFQSLPGNLPFCGATGASRRSLAHSVSIPSREFALLRRACAGHRQDQRRRFNPFQGICPSAACRIRRLDTLALHVSIPSREFALLRRRWRPSVDQSIISFNPFQGICPSAARS